MGAGGIPDGIFIVRIILNKIKVSCNKIKNNI